MPKAIRKGKAIRLMLNLTIATVTGLCLFLGGASFRGSGVFTSLGSQPATAQFVRPQDVWRQVYDRLPNLPLENQYVSQETGEVAASDTLVSRLMRYHIYVKNRPPNYRFDWKLTMADYLGANEFMEESQYPGSTTLRENPLESDRAAIQKLNRVERDTLINVLVSIFNPNINNQTAAPAPSPSPSPPTSNPRTSPQFPQPGDAQLLLP